MIEEYEQTTDKDLTNIIVRMLEPHFGQQAGDTYRRFVDKKDVLPKNIWALISWDYLMRLEKNSVIPPRIHEKPSAAWLEAEANKFSHVRFEDLMQDLENLASVIGNFINSPGMIMEFSQFRDNLKWVAGDDIRYLMNICSRVLIDQALANSNLEIGAIRFRIDDRVGSALANNEAYLDAVVVLSISLEGSG